MTLIPLLLLMMVTLHYYSIIVREMRVLMIDIAEVLFHVCFFSFAIPIVITN